MRLLVPAATAALIAAAAVSAMAATPIAETRTSDAASAASPTTAPLATPSARPAQPTIWRTSAGRPLGDATGVALRAGFVWPLSPRPDVLRRFEQPRSQWSSGHRGVDLLAAVGQPVLSAGDGIVAFSGVVAGRGVLTVQHSDGIRTTYEPVDERLASGTLVHRGTPVGVLSVGPGHCLPLHCLHWGAISGEAYRDPLSLLGFGRPVLLPLG